MADLLAMGGGVVTGSGLESSSDPDDPKAGMSNLREDLVEAEPTSENGDDSLV